LSKYLEFCITPRVDAITHRIYDGLEEASMMAEYCSKSAKMPVYIRIWSRKCARYSNLSLLPIAALNFPSLASLDGLIIGKQRYRFKVTNKQAGKFNVVELHHYGSKRQLCSQR